MTDQVRDLLTAQPVGAGLAPPADHGPDPSTAGGASPSPTTADEQPAGAEPAAPQTTEPAGKPRAAEGGRPYEEERTMPVGADDPPCGARKTDRADADLRFSDRCGNSAFAASAPGGAKAQFPAAPQTTDEVRPLPVGAGLAPPADHDPGPSTAGRASPSPTTADEQPVGADDLGGPQTTDSVRPSPVGAGLAPPADDRPAGEEHPSSAPAGHLLPQGGEGSQAAPAPDYRAHLASLAVQAESLRSEIPGFSLRQALTDPDFLRMTSPAVGLSVRRAWYALHGAELRRAAAEQSALALTGSLASGALRPREGGRGLAAGTLSGSDPRRWSREQRESVRRRVLEAAARGEKIYPEG